MEMKTRLLFVILLHASQHASGVRVEVYEGKRSVLLPCQVPVSVSMDSTAAVWDHDELKISTVHVRLQSGDDLEEQNQLYANRTSMRADALQTGDLSLTLRNPTVSDSGTYTCTVRKYGQDQSRTEVQLKVTEIPDWFLLLSAFLLLLVLVAAAFSVFMYRTNKQLKSRIEETERVRRRVPQWFTTIRGFFSSLRKRIRG